MRSPMLLITCLFAFLLTTAAHAQHEQHAQPQPQESPPRPAPESAHEHHPADAEDTAQPPGATANAPDTASMPTQSEREHVPPDPPQQEVHDMPYEAMAKVMDMDDTEPVGKVLFDQLDWRDAEGADLFAWDAEAWYGNDYNKLWLKAEGERRDGTTEEARTEAHWDHTFNRWWSLQTGVRHDFNEGPSRTWAALGVQGLAPYFFELEATAYVGEAGRTAARLSGEYDLLLTQRLVLQPEAELNLYGKADPENALGSGLSDLQLALRLRYEFRRELAPYIGLVWTRRFGQSADFARDAGDTSDVQLLAGLRVWF